MRYWLVIICSVLTAISIPSEGAKILAVFPYPGPSQYICVLPLLKALTERGHQLTVINAFPQKEKIKNFRDIPVMEVKEGYEDLVADISAKKGIWNEWKSVSEFTTHVTLTVLQSETVQKLLYSGEHFDLFIVEVLFNDALYGIAQHFNAPLIGLSTYGTDEHIDTLVGNTSPLSYVPLITSSLSDHMSFSERVENVYRYLISQLYMHWKHFPRQGQIYRKYFPTAKVDMMELRRNFSLVLLNQHFSLSFPRPYVPNMIEVGGLHINHKPTALPADMEAFINKYKDGVIYFSMGSNIKSKYLPKEKLAILLKTFGSLKQGVLWKYEDPELPGKPDNVFINKWFPQPDVLAHKNVKLFITHGGLLSTIEAIYHGKPIIGVPIFYDQFTNVERAKRAGFALCLDINMLDEITLKTSIERILEDKSFSQIAKELSHRYRDVPITPLETAVFWTEYVLRHNGAKFMRVAAQELNFVQYHSLDVIGVFLCILGIVLLLLWLAVIRVLHFFFRSKGGSSYKHKMQ